MDSISYTAARRNLAQVMDQVCNDNAPVVITHRGKASVVVMSLEEYQAMEATVYLLRSRANALNLLESMSELESSKV
ncbi:MAG: type II toxin-antitoxin system prevent-host-death family antitoxin [Oleispira sp.]